MIISPVPTIAFVTSQQYPQLTADDHLAVLELERAGLTVRPAIWTDARVDWSAFDLVILRSMWDYHLQGGAFFRWLQMLEVTDARVWNPLPLARWNADKRYLRDLGEAGIRIVPTVWFERGERPDLLHAMEVQGWREAVIKPVMSSTAFRTWRVRREEALLCQNELHALLAERPAMIQEFQSAIVREGEWSLVFLDGEPSHAVLKTAVPGDFRVQEEFGGIARSLTAPADAMEQARQAIAAAGSPWLYARVDGVQSADGFRLMELEMLEPSLYFVEHPPAARRFAQAIRRLL